MKNVLLLLFFLIFSIIAFCQNDPEIVFSEKPFLEAENFLIETPNINRKSTTVLGIEENQTFVTYLKGFNTKNNSTIVYCLDENGTLKTKKELKLDTKGAKVNQVILIGDVIRVFFYNFESKTISIRYQDFNKKTLDGKKSVLLTEIEVEKWKGSYVLPFTIKSSSDGSKLMVTISLELMNSLKLFVFDNSMNKIWNKEINFPEEFKSFQVINQEIDQSGNIYLLTGLFEKSISVIPNNCPKEIIVSKFSMDKEEAVYTVNLNKKTNSKIVDMVLDKQGDLVCAGFTSGSSNYAIKSYFSTKLDGLTGDIKSAIDKPLDAKLFNSTTYLTMQKIRINPEGNVTLIAEKSQYISSTSNIISSRSRMRAGDLSMNKFLDIIVVNIDQKNENTWVRIIPKHQFAIPNTYLGSYVLMTTDDHFYFIFNDNSKNITKTKNERIEKFLKKELGVATIVKMDQTGSFERKLLFEPGEKMLIHSSLGKQVSKNKILVFFSGKGFGPRWGFITFD